MKLLRLVPANLQSSQAHATIASNEGVAGFSMSAKHGLMLGEKPSYAGA